MGMKSNCLGLLCILAVTFLTIDNIYPIYTWFTSPIGATQLPMYVYFYPIFAAVIAGSIAIWAAIKTYSGAILNDHREREFRKDALNRQRLTYACDLFYELKDLQASLTVSEGRVKLIKEAFDKGLYSYLQESFSDDYLAKVPLAMKAEWSVQSCLEIDTLKMIFPVRTLVQDIMEIMVHFKSRASVFEEKIKNGLKISPEQKKDTQEVLDIAIDKLKKLQNKTDELQNHLNEKYEIH